MKVLTVKQPWASLIANGYKEYEFRSWKTYYRGPIYIHAGKGVDKKAMERFKHLNLDYPKSLVLASCTLSECIIVTKEFIDTISNDIYTDAPISGYAWHLTDIKKVKQDKQIKGKLGLWNT